VYEVAMQFVEAIPKVKVTPGTIRFWYKSDGDLTALDSIQSTYLWGYSKSQRDPPADPGMPFIGPYQRQLFGDKQLKYLVLLGESEDELGKGLQALRGAGLPFEPLDHIVAAPPPALVPTSVPTLSPWSMILLIAGLAGLGWRMAPRAAA
jgi:IPTL-CTERM motif